MRTSRRVSFSWVESRRGADSAADRTDVTPPRPTATVMIPVELAFENDGYDTAEAAIAAAKNHPSQPDAREDAAAFAGRTFVDAWGDANERVLEFSGGLWLRVFVDGSRVAWAAERVKPDKPPAAGPVVLEWPGGNTSRADPA